MSTIITGIIDFFLIIFGIWFVGIILGMYWWLFYKGLKFGYNRMNSVWYGEPDKKKDADL